MTTLEPATRFPGQHDADVKGISVDPNDYRFVTGSKDTSVVLWDAAKGKPIHKWSDLHSKYVSGVSWSVKQIVASASADNTAKLLDPDSKKVLKTLKHHNKALNTCRFSSDGNYLATGADDNLGALVDVSNSKVKQWFKGHSGIVWNVDVSEDMSLFATGAWDKTCRIWDVRNGEVVKVYDAGSDCNGVAISSDNTLFACGADDHNGYIWDLRAGKKLHTLSGHTLRVLSVAFSPYNNELCTGSADNDAALWNVSSGKRIAKLKGHRDTCTGVAFFADGSLVTSSFDKTAALWNTGPLLEETMPTKGAVSNSSAEKSKQKSSMPEHRSVSWTMTDGGTCTGYFTSGSCGGSSPNGCLHLQDVFKSDRQNGKYRQAAEASAYHVATPHWTCCGSTDEGSLHCIAKWDVDVSATSRPYRPRKASVTSVASTSSVASVEAPTKAKTAPIDKPKISTATSAVMDAAKSGQVTQPFGHCRLNIVGQGRAGKTSLLRSLNGEAFDSKQESTIGIASDALLCELTQNETTHWKRRKDDLGATERAMLAEIQQRLQDQGKDEETASADAMKLLLESKKVGAAITADREKLFEQQGNRVAQAVVGDARAPKKKGLFGTLGRSRKSRKSLPVPSAGDGDAAPPSPSGGVKQDKQDKGGDKSHKSDKKDDKGSAAADNLDSGLADCISRMDQDFVSKCLDELGTGGQLPLIFDTWDYAGQKVFYALFSLFLSPLGIFVVVFNQTKLLTNIREGRPLNTDAAMGLNEDDALGYLDFWLESIDEHARGAPVCLVGTHKDMVSARADHEAISNALVHRYRKKPSIISGIVPNKQQDLFYFPIDNTLSDCDESIQHLRLAIETTANGLDFTKTPVPLAWLELMDTLNQLARPSKPQQKTTPALEALRAKYDPTNNGIQRLTLDEVRALAKHGIPDDGLFRAALDFCHEVGVILHFNGKDVDSMVFLKPQYLIERITRIIRDFQLHSMATSGNIGQASSMLSLLSEHAVLCEQLLPMLWTENTEMERRQLLKIMIMFDLAVPWKGFGEPSQYLIPTLLSDKKLKPRSAVGEMYIAFGKEITPFNNGLSFDCLSNECFLPFGLFSCLTAQVVAHCQRTKGGAAELSSSVVRIAFGVSEFELRHLPHMNAVQIVCFVPNGLPVLDRVQRCVARLLSDRFPRLQFHLLVPAADDRLVTLQGLHEDFIAKKSVVLVGTEDRGLPTKVKLRELEHKHRVWLPRLGIEEFAHVMISYRQAADGEFARLLWDSLTLESVGDGEQPIVFFDQMFLEQGERFDVAFMTAITRALVCAPVISLKAVESMKWMVPSEGTDRLDNVLLEWCLQSFLADLGKVKLVVPVFIGGVDDDKDEPTSFFRHFQAEDFADEVSELTHAKFASFVTNELKMKEPPRRTIRKILEDIITYQGLKAWQIAENEEPQPLDPRLNVHPETPSLCSAKLCEYVNQALSKTKSVGRKKSLKTMAKPAAPRSEPAPVSASSHRPAADPPAGVSSEPLKQWSEDDVIAWCNAVGLKKCISIFEEEEVNGCILANLTQDYLKEELGMKRMLAHTVISERDKLL